MTDKPLYIKYKKRKSRKRSYNRSKGKKHSLRMRRKKSFKKYRPMRKRRTKKKRQFGGLLPSDVDIYNKLLDKLNQINNANITEKEVLDMCGEINSAMDSGFGNAFMSGKIRSRGCSSLPDEEKIKCRQEKIAILKSIVGILDLIYYKKFDANTLKIINDTIGKVQDKVSKHERELNPNNAGRALIPKRSF